MRGHILRSARLDPPHMEGNVGTPYYMIQSTIGADAEERFFQELALMYPVVHLTATIGTHVICYSESQARNAPYSAFKVFKRLRGSRWIFS